MSNEIIIVLVFLLILVIIIACSNTTQSWYVMSVITTFVILAINLITYKTYLGKELEQDKMGSKSLPSWKKKFAEKFTDTKYEPHIRSLWQASDDVDNFTHQYYDSSGMNLLNTDMQERALGGVPSDPPQNTKPKKLNDAIDIEQEYDNIFGDIFTHLQDDRHHGMTYDQEIAWQNMVRGKRGRRNAVGANLNRVAYTKNRMDLTNRESANLHWWDELPKKWNYFNV